MDDEEVAYLVLSVAAVRDAGCEPCVGMGVDAAVFSHPELPYERVARSRFDGSESASLIDALTSARASGVSTATDNLRRTNGLLTSEDENADPDSHPG